MNETNWDLEISSGAAEQRMPIGVAYIVHGVIVALLAGGLYLIAVRGEALVADLGALAALICG